MRLLPMLDGGLDFAHRYPVSMGLARARHQRVRIDLSLSDTNEQLAFANGTNSFVAIKKATAHKVPVRRHGSLPQRIEATAITGEYDRVQYTAMRLDVVRPNVSCRTIARQMQAIFHLPPQKTETNQFSLRFHLPSEPSFHSNGPLGYHVIPNVTQMWPDAPPSALSETSNVARRSAVGF
jgi:hypothetical protein